MFTAVVRVTAIYFNNYVLSSTEDFLGTGVIKYQILIFAKEKFCLSVFVP